MVKKLWVIIAFLMLACGEDPDFATVTLEESLVFGTREALQSRTGIKSTEAGTAPELQGSFQTAMLTRGAALLQVVPTPGSGPACSGNRSFGSSQLVGDRTLVTAVHVIAGKDPQIFAAFEGAARTDILNLSDAIHGTWLPDNSVIPISSTHTNDYASVGDESPSLAWGVYSTYEESPLLAERLFQLSFHVGEFNTDTDPSYNRLPYTGSGLPPMRQVRNAFRTQWPVKRNEITWNLMAKQYRRDIAIVEALDLQDQNPLLEFFYNNGWGVLDLDRPAVFFNRSDFQEATGKVAETLKPDAVLVHFSHLSNLFHFYKTSMYSPGILRRDWASVNTDLIYCDSLGSETYASVVTTKAEIDALAGSSGGGVMTCDAPGCARWVADGHQDLSSHANLVTRGVVATVSNSFKNS